MKTHSILLFLLLTTPCFSGDIFKVGILLSPNLCWNRVLPEQYQTSTAQTYQTSGNGIRLRGVLGLYLDRHIQDNFAFGFGLNYIFSGSGLEIVEKNTGSIITATYALQFIQAPMYIKFVSNEVTERIYIFTKGGIGPAVRTSAKLNGDKTYQTGPGSDINYVKDHFKLFTIDALLSAGIEYELNGDTRLTAGFTYNRGLTNIYKESRFTSSIPNFQLYNDYVSLDLGIKF